MPKMLATSVVVNDPTSGEYTTFREGHVFADGDWALAYIGEHCFTSPAGPGESGEDQGDDPKSYDTMIVRELLEEIERRNNLGEQIEPDSGKKDDLVKALEFADEMKRS